MDPGDAGPAGIAAGIVVGISAGIQVDLSDEVQAGLSAGSFLRVRDVAYLDASFGRNLKALAPEVLANSSSAPVRSVSECIQT